MIKTNAYKIEYTNNTNSYTLYIKGSNNLKDGIYKSISDTKLLSSAFYNDDDDDDISITFTAETVVTLTRFLTKGKLTNKKTVKMINDLSRQIAYLETTRFAFYGYNLDDILVINDDTFFIANTKHLLDIKKDNCIYFYNPIDRPYFSNFELNKLTKLPSKIDYRSSYYSLGALILFCMTNVYIFAEIQDIEYVDVDVEIDKILTSIAHTKLYWFLKRCFNKKSEDRILLFI
jgi:hypothetical protein